MYTSETHRKLRELQCSLGPIPKKSVFEDTPLLASKDPKNNTRDKNLKKPT